MASSASISPLRRAIEDKLSQLSAEVETFLADARERGRRELADQLNLAVRRMRLAPEWSELAATLADASGAFAAGAAVFRVEGEVAVGERMRGVSDESAEKFRGLRVPLASAAALRGAVQTRDPVTALSTPSEVSEDMVKLAAHPADGRVNICPVVVGERTVALLYAWGIPRFPVQEVLAQMASAVWPPEPAPETPPAAELLQIAAAPLPPAPQAEGPEPESVEEPLHLRARRFARVRVAEIRLYEADAVQNGRARRNLYGTLRERIDSARSAYLKRFRAEDPAIPDYLHMEILATLAGHDADLLGKEYPGPMA